MRPVDADHVDQRLRELSETLGAELVAEIIVMFREDGTAQLTDLHKARDRREFKAMQSAAHRLLGSVLLVGARHLAQLCRKLELLVRQEDAPGAEAVIAELAQEFTLLLNWVSSSSRRLCLSFHVRARSPEVLQVLLSLS